jgi:hypothetical protein
MRIRTSQGYGLPGSGSGATKASWQTKRPKRTKCVAWQQRSGLAEYRDKLLAGMLERGL